jgi:outer membrane protein OmpA-like peptidoglycan-associated protein
MKCSTSAKSALHRAVLAQWGLVLLAGALVMSAPAGAGDTPSLQEFLGRAQTQSERKAVEDLVEKLQGGPRKAPSSAPSAPPAAAPAKTPAPIESAPADPVPDQKVAAPTTITPQAAVQGAERKQLPSVDLEIYFEYDAARITPQAAQVLATLGRALVDARLAEDAFLIAGHTDAKGRDEYNLALSHRRAEAVRQFLIDNFKIEAGKLVAKGFGRQHLKNPRLPLAGENRRVQIVNLTKAER